MDVVDWSNVDPREAPSCRLGHWFTHFEAKTGKLTS